MGSGVRSGKLSTGRNLLNFRLNHAALAYAMTTLGAAMINNIFSFYYVKLFINKYKTSETAFHQSQVRMPFLYCYTVTGCWSKTHEPFQNQMSKYWEHVQRAVVHHRPFHPSALLLSACLISAQLVFMVWNAVNDPLFGYLQDTSKMRCCSQRRLSILYGAPLYSLTFLLPWFPWRSYYPGDWLSGLHLMVALCAFDGLLTFVLLAQCALFAEISSNHQNRLRLVQYSQVPVQIPQMPRGSVPGSLISSLFRPRWPLSSAPPASSSVVFCLETWRTLQLFRPSRCWSRC